MNKFTILLLLPLSLLFIQCSSSSEPGEDNRRKPADMTLDEIKTVESTTGFALDLFQNVVNQEEENENVFISPLSVSFALGMAYNGADGDTRDAIASTLGLSEKELEEINESYKGVIDLLTNLDPTVAMSIANSFWFKQGYEPNPDFIQLNQNYFYALVRNLNFLDPGAADIINQWVSDNTRGKIREIVDSPISDEVVAYLINAVYFKANWTDRFDPENTTETDFYLQDNSTVTCQMMSKMEVCGYHANDLFSAIDLKYGSETFSMTILLPAEGETVESVAGEINLENWNIWITNLQEHELPVNIPRFTFEYELELNDILSQMGMEIAFIPGAADFSNIFTSNSSDLYISKVKHKTYVKVDESGTEAAGVTSIEIGETSIPESFIANRPFIFVIRENVSGAILFMGKMMNPVAEE